MTKKVLFIDLMQKHAEVQLIPELSPFIGGVAMGVKLYSLYKDVDPVVVSVGPLNGYFPFASKTCFVVENEGMIEDLYLGGSLGYRLAFSGVDALVLAGACDSSVVLDIIDEEVKFLDVAKTHNGADFSSLGLPGRRSILQMDAGNLILDGYFGLKVGFVEKKFIAKRLLGFCLTGTKVVVLNDVAKYTTLFNQILSQAGSLGVDFGGRPSCSGCPLGCSESRVGEMGGNILLHSLVACGYAENIYSNLGTVFACLDALGYNYTHEQLEALPDLFTKTLKEIEQNGD